MLLRAWGRATALLFRRSAVLVFSNLQASLFLSLAVLANALARGLNASAPGLVFLKGLSGLAAWMALSWVFYACRAALEKPQFKAGWSGGLAWLRLRGAERLGSFAVFLAAWAWTGIALDFYRAAAPGSGLASAALALVALTAFVLAAALAMNFALASRDRVAFAAEWKASLFMALAFAPQCLAALGSLLLFSGAAGIMSGLSGFWKGLASLPALAMPVFGAAYLASFLVALSDEFLARSHGLEPPAYEPFSFKELMQPWR